MIILYYVYFDTTSRWYAGSDYGTAASSDYGTTASWHQAQEFTTREAAKEIADELDGVVFGWVQ